MKTNGADGEDCGQDVLTEKQRVVLDLLIENKTSKEIARVLGISPYTVDQRISLARGKLGVSSRSELAARYRGMRKPKGLRPPQILADSDEARPEPPGAREAADGAEGNAAEHVPGNGVGEVLTAGHLARRKKSFPTDGVIDHRVGPEVFEGRHGGLWRLGAVVVTALLLVMTILGLFAIFAQLNDILA